MVNGKQYLIKGVCYNPVPKGRSDRTFDRLTEDLALMVEAGINTIRVYSPIADKSVLDEIHAAGLKVIIGFGYNNGTYNIRSGSLIQYIDTYKDHGAILFWELGNEYNYHPEWFDGDVQNWYTALNKAARTIHRHDPSHPVATAHGGLPDDDTLSACPHIDVWGINAYCWDHPAPLISEWNAKCSKPMYMSEAGADRYMTASRHGYSQGENEEAQADATKNILDEVFSAKRICAGVTLFAFVDEWWKAGNPATQDSVATACSGFPYDDAANEEYWGIVDIDRSTKKAYEVVKKKYTRVR
jgi:exo-beta-1,3-glucanase (GH17 family)